MKKYISGLLLLVCMGMVACNWGKKPAESEESKVDSTLTAEVEAVVPDSAIYGRLALDEMGMSTFALVPNGVDSVMVLMRDAEDGSAAKIFGPIEKDSEWTVTLRADNGEDEYRTIDRAINVSLLKLFVKDYVMRNAQLVLGDTARVDLVELTDKHLVYNNGEGKQVELFRLR